MRMMKMGLLKLDEIDVGNGGGVCVGLKDDVGWVRMCCIVRWM